MDTPSSTSKLKKLFDRMAGRDIDQEETGDAISFKKHQEAEGAYEREDRGIRTVKLNKIIGSVGRYQDFDQKFRFKGNVVSDRFEAIVKAMREGHPLPPVKLYQIKDNYYVLDGNHRVAAAKKLNHDEILASVVELIPSIETPENVLYKELMTFSESTGLPREINLTEIGQYHILMDQIYEHQRYLEKENGESVEIKPAAKDWYKTIYQPLCKVIKRGRLAKNFPGRTIADFYVYISFNHWNKNRKRQYGIGIEKNIPNDMEVFRKKMMDLKDVDYPEMKRSITAFILLNVQGKREFQIIDKLFELDEVVEIHSIHGDIDLLIKVILSRDLISSDAETISNFVHNKIRLLNGVNSSKTLIPGISKTKQVKLI